MLIKIVVVISPRCSGLCSGVAVSLQGSNRMKLINSHDELCVRPWFVSQAGLSAFNLFSLRLSLFDGLFWHLLFICPLIILWWQHQHNNELSA